MSRITKTTEYIKSNDQKQCKIMIYELTRACMTKEISTENFVTIMESLNKNHSELLYKYLIETLWMFGLSIEKKFDAIEESSIKEYSNMINLLIKKGILSKIKLMEKLEEGSLCNIGLISSVEAFNRKSIRINTKNT